MTNTNTTVALPVITPTQDATNKCERVAKSLERIADMIRDAQDKIWHGQLVDADNTIIDENDVFYGLIPVDRISPDGLFYISNLPEIGDPIEWAKCPFKEILDIVLHDGLPMAVVRLEPERLWPSFTFNGMSWYDDVYM